MMVIFTEFQVRKRSACFSSVSTVLKFGSVYRNEKEIYLPETAVIVAKKRFANVNAAKTHVLKKIKHCGEALFSRAEIVSLNNDEAGVLQGCVAALQDFALKSVCIEFQQIRAR